MTENGNYAKETAHLTQRQKVLYDLIEVTLMEEGTDNEDYLDSLAAVEALARTMLMSYGLYRTLI